MLLILLASHFSESAPIVMMGGEREADFLTPTRAPKGLKPSTFGAVIYGALEVIFG